MLNNKITICDICHKDSSRYTCPKCFINYCSLECYQSQLHMTCSEEFYRERCLEAYKEIEKTSYPQSVPPSLDLIDDTDDRDYEPDLETRLRYININDKNTDFEQIWSVLTKTEQRKFLRAIESGEISNLIPVYDPWWNKKVTENPVVQENLPTLSEVLPADVCPHHSVAYSLSDIILGYCFVVVYFNGEIFHDLAEEAAQLLSELVSSLSSLTSKSTDEMANRKLVSGDKLVNRAGNKRVNLHDEPCPVYENFDQVIAKFSQRLAMKNLPCNENIMFSLTLNFYKIISNSAHLARSLGECHKLLRRVKLKFHKVACKKVRFHQACVNLSDARVQHWWKKAIEENLIPQIKLKVLEMQSTLSNDQDITEQISSALQSRSSLPHWKKIINIPTIDGNSKKRLLEIVDQR